MKILISRKGKIMYVPPVVLTELNDIMRENKVPNKADAFKEMTKYARVGRETERLMRLDFRKAGKLPPINYFYLKEKKKNKGFKWL